MFLELSSENTKLQPFLSLLDGAEATTKWIDFKTQISYRKIVDKA